MGTVVTFRSSSADETFGLGVALGRALVGGDFVGLSGQLGAGKTQFARGVAHGAAVPLDDVSSPTYPIVQTYSGRIRLHHADLYRLATEGDLFATGYFDLLDDAEGALLVEWVEQVRGAAPEDALTIGIAVVDASSREVTVTAKGQRSEALVSRWRSELGKPAQA